MCDILLFAGNKAMHSLTRAVTWSDFDHVAMILKFGTDPNEVYFVEATGGVGVCINRWSYIRSSVGANQFFKMCVFRHVEFERTDE